MNRLVLIGNGFDLAHGLKTSYADFINWYCDKRVLKMSKSTGRVSEDSLCTFKYLKEEPLFAAFIGNPNIGKGNGYGNEVIKDIIRNTYLFETKISPFFEKIRTSIETKGWVDIENAYYALLKKCAFPVLENPFSTDGIAQLNAQLLYVQGLLVQYLQEVEQQGVNEIKSIRDAIYAPFDPQDISIYGQGALQEHVDHWIQPQWDAVLNHKLNTYGTDMSTYLAELDAWRNKNAGIYHHNAAISVYPKAFLLPNDIVFLDFNYTHTINHYIAPSSVSLVNYIHGDINHSDSIIFGYGDELDEQFTRIQNLNDNAYLQNIKSIRYLEAPNYRKMLSFIESAPFQVLIMGHSCGNSDRTLLNTIFEHKNCVSIKPYYYIKNKEKGVDNYRELVQNISRNFTDKKLMRDRVVNKTYCSPLWSDVRED